MNTSELLNSLAISPESINFQDVIAHIDNHYNFTPTEFKNGNVTNLAGQNNGSCKIFSFAKLHQLSEESTLALFGDFYRIDVLCHPEKDDHQNIRNFIKFGWSGIQFSGKSLTTK